MVIVMKDDATDSQIEAVSEQLKSVGFRVHKIVGVNRTVIGAIGDKRTIDIREFELAEGVHEVLRITEPYKLASRILHPENTVVEVKGVVRCRFCA